MKKFFIKDNVCTPYKLILSKTENFLTQNGWSKAASADEADVHIVGMCAAFHSLEDEALEFVQDAKKTKAEVIAYGCLSTISPEKLAELGPDQTITAPQWERLEELVKEPMVPLATIAPTTEFREKEEYRVYDPGKRFILIQTGCSSNCNYCTHKLGIGDLMSRPVDEIMQQVKALSAEDVHTIVLHGNDTGSYGRDIGTTYTELLREALEYKPNLHITQLNADWVYTYREELFPLNSGDDALLMNQKIKDFQVLIQTTSDRILKTMRRRPIVNDLHPYLVDLRKRRKDLFFRTDVMMGYPSATLEEEQRTLEFAAELFDEIAVHAFEQFEHTPIGGQINKGKLEPHSEEEAEKRALNAVEYLTSFPGKIVHRGGQVYQTMFDNENAKDELREQMGIVASCESARVVT